MTNGPKGAVRALPAQSRRTERALARPSLSAAALLCLVIALAPPLSSWSHRYSTWEALQYGLVAVVVPALTVLGAPWRLLGLGPAFTRLEQRRPLQPGVARATALLVPALVLLAVWRSPALVDRLASNSWLVLAEAVTLVPAGIAVWLELVPSAPLTPHLPPYLRIAVAAVTMWTIWILAYLLGLAGTNTYPAYAHVAHRAVSVAADQQLTAGVMWLVAACAFVPVVFANLMTWLRNEPLEQSS
ncbi:MAG: cytochrome c oxidase assembly protein [Acidimicrobiales bacterium]